MQVIYAGLERNASIIDKQSGLTITTDQVVL